MMTKKTNKQKLQAYFLYKKKNNIPHYGPIFVGNRNKQI